MKATDSKRLGVITKCSGGFSAPCGRIVGGILLGLCAATASEPELGRANRELEGGLSGGQTTVFNQTAKAFNFPVPNITPEHRTEFFVGNSFFNENWVTAPASAQGRDGLGPLFNTRSCSACHFNDGRSQPPPPGEPMATMLMRISVPGTGPHGEPLPERTYGLQIQGRAILGVPPEGDVYVNYNEISGNFADGQPFELLQPVYTIRNLGYGPLDNSVLMSPRVAPAMIGLGLLEAVPEKTLITLAQQQKEHGMAGRINYVWDPVMGETVVGRFGWKAEQPTVLHQTAGAFAGDMGITSSLVPAENHTEFQDICLEQASGGTPEVSDKILQAVATYSRTLGVPARRDWASPLVRRGERLFVETGCATCHVPELQTGDWAEFPELSNQVIRPYTDLLLHDMGEGLSDDRPVFKASGRDWRTPPLWGIGLVAKVNGHTRFLHDGRARNLSEAILWHGGEAEDSRETFRKLPEADRTALLTFLESL